MNPDQRPDLSRANFFFLGLAFIVGASLRIIQYAAGPSYWKDELFSIINIENMSLNQLITEQPEYNQVAGVGYYVIQKTILLLAGVSNEWVLRLYPFLASLLCMWVFYLIARRFLGGWLLVVSVGLFCLSLGPWVQSFNAKPYSGDLLFIMWFVWFMLYLQDRIPGQKQIWLAGIIGFTGATASLPAAVFVFGAIPFLLWQRSEHVSWKSLLPAFALWTLGALWNIYYAKFVITPEVESAMFGHHNDHGVFPPADSVTGFLLFYPKALANNLMYFLLPSTNDPVSLTRVVILLIMTAGGILVLLKKNIAATLALSLPLLMALALVTAFLYPLGQRFSMYAAWPCVLFPFILIDWSKERFRTFRPWMANTFALLILLPSILIVVLGVMTLPLVAEPAKEAFATIKQHRNPGDEVYVHATGDLYVEYYGPRIGLENITLGSPGSLESPDAYKADLQPLNGRVWYLFIGHRPEMNPELSASEIEEIANQQGRLLEEFRWTTGYPSYLNLYDFSQSPVTDTSE